MVVAVRKSSAKAALFKRAIALFGAAKQHCAVPRWIRTATADIPSISGKFCSFFKVFYVLVPSCTIFLTYSDLFKSVKNDMFLCRKNTDLRESIYTIYEYLSSNSDLAPMFSHQPCCCAPPTEEPKQIEKDHWQSIPPLSQAVDISARSG